MSNSGKSRRPNFFLVGAPKSGTTALARYLGEHPQILVSNPKETFYFCDDFQGLSSPSTEDEYLALFDAADRNTLAAGEATTVYMYSQSAPQRIHAFDRNARILVMLRCPIDLAVSYHAEHLYGLSEDEPDFERAWRLREARIRGENLPPLVIEPKLIQYRDVAMLGSQMERLLEIFDREQVHVVLFEDFVRDTAAEYEGVLRFLGVPPDGRREFPVVNERKENRYPALARILQRPPRFVSRSLARAKKAIGMENVGLLDFARRFNTAPMQKVSVSGALREEMRDAFRDDVELLSALIGRDLSHWLD
jgi:Sulfotransferase domain